MEERVLTEYYVYEWIRLDTNEPFYVGKGKEDRCYKLKRGNNKHFNNIVNSIPVAVNILKYNLDEITAFEYECYYIWFYRDVIGYDMCNICDGGEGCSINQKPLEERIKQRNNFEDELYSIDSNDYVFIGNNRRFVKNIKTNKIYDMIKVFEYLKKEIYSKM